MTAKTLDVIAIGNAIVDIIGHCDEAFLARHGATKGSMQLVDANRITQLYGDMGPGIEISGGSAANTMAGIASLGGKSGFIGKVADDDFGRIFRHDIKSAGVMFETAASSGGAPTARSLILVTPDGERTMNTFLGVSPELTIVEIDSGLIDKARIVYLEGYLFDRDEAKAAFREAADHATKSGAKVAMTLSDSFCVDRHRGEFLTFIRSHADILFANESEVTSLYETKSFDEAAKLASGDVALAVLTRSAKGAIIFEKGHSVTVPADRIEKVVDTTGAGDLYAAGFLFGHARGFDNTVSGRLGALAAAEIISHVGARPNTPLAELAAKRGLI